DRHVPVLGGVDAVGCREIPTCDVAKCPRARRLHGGIGPGDERFRLQVEGRLQQARIDAAALPRTLPPHDGGDDAEGKQRRTMMVDDGGAGGTRSGGGLAGDRHHAKKPPPDQVPAPPSPPTPPPPPPPPP